MLSCIIGAFVNVYWTFLPQQPEMGCVRDPGGDGGGVPNPPNICKDYEARFWGTGGDPSLKFICNRISMSWTRKVQMTWYSTSMYFHPHTWMEQANAPLSQMSWIEIGPCYDIASENHVEWGCWLGGCPEAGCGCYHLFPCTTTTSDLDSICLEIWMMLPLIDLTQWPDWLLTSHFTAVTGLSISHWLSLAWSQSAATCSPRVSIKSLEYISPLSASAHFLACW